MLIKKCGIERQIKDADYLKWQQKGYSKYEEESAEQEKQPISTPEKPKRATRQADAP